MLYLLIEEGFDFSADIQEYLGNLEVEFETKISENILEDSVKLADLISEDPQVHRGIIIDEDAIGPFMVATKRPHIICAMLNDEQSAMMTRDHNNANVITLGHRIIGLEVMKGIIKRFATHDYAGGRHQVRVDMLDSMIAGEKND